MALKIDLPSAGLLGIAGVSAFVLTGAEAPYDLSVSSVYILSDDAINPYTVNLPASPISGSELIIKNLSSVTVTIAEALIEGVMTSIEITNNQPVRLIRVSDALGWALI